MNKNRPEFRPWIALVWVPTPVGVISVLDPHKPMPWFWKPPGGRGNWEDRVPESTAIREFEEETGGRLKYLRKIGRPFKRVNNQTGIAYETHVFEGTPTDDCLERLLARGNEDEFVRIIPYDELRITTYYHPQYKFFMMTHGLWPK